MHDRRNISQDLKFLAFVFACSFGLTTSTVWFVEGGGEQFSNFTDVMWWWVVTSTTVGYGDLVPTTLLGRSAGVIAIIVGIYGYTHTISLILQNVQAKLDEEERGTGRVECHGHVLLFEYTAFADELIQEIEQRDLFTRRDVVIASTLVSRQPYPRHEFVFGEPLSPDTHERASTEDAAVVFVFANQRFSDPDVKTLHVASRLMRTNDDAVIFVELNDAEHRLLDELPRPVRVMPTDSLLESSIRHENLDLDRFELSEESLRTQKMSAV